MCALLIRYCVFAHIFLYAGHSDDANDDIGDDWDDFWNSFFYADGDNCSSHVWPLHVSFKESGKHVV